jgi:hypothetical protein
MSNGVKASPTAVSEEKNQTSTPDRATFRPEHIDYGVLLPFVDVINAAVYGYGAYEVAKALDPLLRDPPAAPDWGRVILLAFVAYFLTADSVEARIYNEIFRYRNRRRFLIDLLIAGCFFLAFMSAGAASTFVLVALAAVFFGGALWAVCLELEIRDSVYWIYPRMSVASHTGAAVAFGWVFYSLSHRPTPVHVLTVAMAGVLWAGYALWLLGVTVLRRLFKVPAAEADLLPVGLAADLIWGCAKGCRRFINFMTGRRSAE